MLSGKRSAILDLDHPRNRAQLESLLATTDVMVQGYRPGLLQRHRLDAAAAAHLHPHLSVVTMSAWGRKGLWRPDAASTLCCSALPVFLQGPASAANREHFPPKCWTTALVTWRQLPPCLP